MFYITWKWHPLWSFYKSHFFGRNFAKNPSFSVWFVANSISSTRRSHPNPNIGIFMHFSYRRLPINHCFCTLTLTVIRTPLEIRHFDGWVQFLAKQDSNHMGSVNRQCRPSKDVFLLQIFIKIHYFLRFTLIILIYFQK